MANKRLVIVLSVLLVIALSGCGGKTNNNTTPSSTVPPASSPAAGDSVNAEAEALYKANCIVCHAADLSGGAGPNLQNLGSRLTADQINAKISNGGGGMPAFKGTLSADEINILTQWLVAKT